MMHPYRRQAIVLLLMMGIVALLAQVAGVGGTRSTKQAAPVRATLAVLAGGSVPDRASTTLDSTKIKAAEGDALRMRATATVHGDKLPRRSAAQVVCGIRYSRSGNPSWSLGTPYETVLLKARGASEKVTIERSFTAPAADTYRMSVACHVASPATGATVTATGSMRAAVGLPTGAALPVE